MCPLCLLKFLRQLNRVMSLSFRPSVYPPVCLFVSLSLCLSVSLCMSFNLSLLHTKHKQATIHTNTPAHAHTYIDRPTDRPTETNDRPTDTPTHPPTFLCWYQRTADFHWKQDHKDPPNLLKWCILLLWQNDQFNYFKYCKHPASQYLEGTCIFQSYVELCMLEVYGVAV